MVSVNRLSGLVSGLDTDSMVKSMIAAAKVPVDKINQQKQMLQWKLEDYRTLNSKVLDFKNASFNMKLQSTYLNKTATSSQESALTATGTANAIDGSYTVKVDKMAKPASLITGQLVKASDGTTPATADSTLGDLGLTDTGGSSDGILTIKGPKSSSGYNLTVTSEMKLSELVTQINGQSSTTGVKATYDSTMNRIFFVSTQTGEKDMELTLKKPDGTTTNGDLGKMFQLSTAVGSGTYTGTNADSSFKVTGQNAEVTFNGVSGEYDSNTFSIAGLTLTAKAENTTTTVTVNQNTDAIFNSIKSFVDKYNDLISSITTKTSETYDRDYAPLTDDQKESMSEDEITKWETQAKTGMLSRDQMLQSGVNSFRRAFSDSISGVSSSFKNLSQIGIGTSIMSGTSVSGSYSDNGKIYIDETKLKAAIAENPDEVMKLFTANDNNSSTDSGDGLALRLYDKASALFSRIVDTAGTSTSVKSTFSIGKQMVSMEKRISTMNDRLSDLETRYYNQFSTMESYLNKMNSQSSWLTSQTSS